MPMPVFKRLTCASTAADRSSGDGVEGERAPESRAPAARASGFQTLSRGAPKFAVLLGKLRFGFGRFAGDYGLVCEPLPLAGH